MDFELQNLLSKFNKSFTRNANQAAATLHLDYVTT